VPFLAFFSKNGHFDHFPAFSGSRLKGFYINPSRRGPAVPAEGPEGPPRAPGSGDPSGSPGGSPPPRLGAKVPDGVSGAGSPAGRFGYSSDKQIGVTVQFYANLFGG